MPHGFSRMPPLWEKDSLFKSGAGKKMDIHMQKNETGPLLYTRPKNLTVDQRQNTALEENIEERCVGLLVISQATRGTGKESRSR